MDAQEVKMWYPGYRGYTFRRGRMAGAVQDDGRR